MSKGHSVQCVGSDVRDAHITYCRAISSVLTSKQTYGQTIEAVELNRGASVVWPKTQTYFMLTTILTLIYVNMFS